MYKGINISFIYLLGSYSYKKSVTNKLKKQYEKTFLRKIKLFVVVEKPTKMKLMRKNCKKWPNSVQN